MSASKKADRDRQRQTETDRQTETNKDRQTDRDACRSWCCELCAGAPGAVHGGPVYEDTGWSARRPFQGSTRFAATSAFSPMPWCGWQPYPYRPCRRPLHHSTQPFRASASWWPSTSGRARRTCWSGNRHFVIHYCYRLQVACR